MTGGLAEFGRVLDKELATDELFALLADDEPAVEADLRETDLDRVRSARFIRGEVYGTRSSTVLTVGADRRDRVRGAELRCAGGRGREGGLRAPGGRRGGLHGGPHPGLGSGTRPRTDRRRGGQPR